MVAAYAEATLQPPPHARTLVAGQLCRRCAVCQCAAAAEAAQARKQLRRMAPHASRGEMATRLAMRCSSATHGATAGGGLTTVIVQSLFAQDSRARWTFPSVLGQADAPGAVMDSDRKKLEGSFIRQWCVCLDSEQHFTLSHNRTAACRQLVGPCVHPVPCNASVAASVTASVAASVAANVAVSASLFTCALATAPHAGDLTHARFSRGWPYVHALRSDQLDRCNACQCQCGHRRGCAYAMLPRLYVSCVSCANAVWLQS